jgi:hypothetical protein
VVSGGDTRERQRARYRRRKPIPAVIVVCLLVVAVIVVWVKVFGKASDVNAIIACAPSSTAKQPIGTPVAYDSLDKIAPEPAADVKVQVYNATTQRGAALQVSNQLSQAGFQVAAPANDPLYPKADMACRGQIRFGANGESAARTISMVVPCTQLVRDNRQDSTVDLSIGKTFTGVAPNSSAQQALAKLASWAASHPAPQGGQQALNSVLPQLAPDLLAAAHPDQC